MRPVTVLLNKELAVSNAPTGRTRVFTDDVLADIPKWVAARVGTEAIAEKLGVTVGSLKVACSNAGISLDPDNYIPTGVRIDFQLDYRLGLTHMSRLSLRTQAQKLHMTERELISLLLYFITKDNMYEAILDMKD